MVLQCLTAFQRFTHCTHCQGGEAELGPCKHQGPAEVHLFSRAWTFTALCSRPCAAVRSLRSTRTSATTSSSMRTAVSSTARAPLSLAVMAMAVGSWWRSTVLRALQHSLSNRRSNSLDDNSVKWTRETLAWSRVQAKDSAAKPWARYTYGGLLCCGSALLSVLGVR